MEESRAWSPPSERRQKGGEISLVFVGQILAEAMAGVLDQLGCDVLVLKPKGFMSPVTFKTVPKGAVFAD